MARILKLVDSSAALTEISLINVSGIIGNAGRLGGVDLDASQITADNPLMGVDVSESYDLNVYGTSQDNTTSTIQALAKMLRKARQFFTTAWQTAPVYLQAQQASETSARYALVKRALRLGMPDVFDLPFEADARLEGVTLDLVREHPWRGTAPGTLPTALTLTKTDGSVDATRCHIVPVQHGQAASHLFNYDNSLTAYSTNQIAATGITLWSVSGSTPAVNDAIYIGFDTRVGFNLVIPIATAGSFSATVAVEFWNGSAWTALTAGTGYTIFPTGDINEVFKSTGEWVVAFYPGATWATTAVNSVTAYWVRLRLSAVTTWTTTPVSHASETCYTQRKPYFEISSARVGGDAPPRAMFRFLAPHGGATTEGMGLTSRILVGAKSRNLTNFVSQLHLHNYGLPGSWTRALGTDTTEVVDVRAPEGYHSACSFATSAAMQARVTLTGADLFDDYIGAYRVILIAEQSGGTAGDMAVKVRFLQGPSVSGQPYQDTETVSPDGVGQGYEAIDLGVIQLPFGPTVYADSMTTDIIIEAHAERTGGAGVLRFSRLVLLPIDEWFFMADDPVMDEATGTSALRGNTRLDVDFGVLADRTIKQQSDGGTWVPAQIWHRSSAITRVLPATQYRFYCLLLHYPTTFGAAPLVVSSAAHLAVEMYAVNSYLTLRGAG